MTRRLAHPALCLLALAACGDKPDDGDDTGDAGEPTVGFVHACVSGPFDNPYEDPEYSSFWTTSVSGTVVSDAAGSDVGDTPLECYGFAHRVLTLTDAEGETWRFSYGVDDGDEQDVTPALDVSAGGAVTVTFRAVLDFGSANGFVVTDSAGLVGAVEAGTWGSALEAGDVPGLTVQVGDPYGEVDTDCGTRVHDELVFVGDTSVTLAPFEVGSVSVGGVPLDAYGMVATRFEDVQCTDLAGNVSWAVFR